MAMRIESMDVAETDVEYGYEPTPGIVIVTETEDEARAHAQALNCPLVVRTWYASGWAELS